MKKPKTKKQQKFFKELPNSKSAAEAARKAGYSEKSARVSAHKNITEYNEFLAYMMQESGVDIELVAKNLNKGLRSKDPRLRFHYTKLSLNLFEKAFTKNEKDKKRISSGFDQPVNSELTTKEKEDLRIALDGFKIS